MRCFLSKMKITAVAMLAIIPADMNPVKTCAGVSLQVGETTGSLKHFVLLVSGIFPSPQSEHVLFIMISFELQPSHRQQHRALVISGIVICLAGQVLLQ